MIPYEVNLHIVSERRNYLSVKNMPLYAADKNKTKLLMSCDEHNYGVLTP